MSEVVWIATGPPEPGERCPRCTRRVPKPRKSSSPTTKRIVAAAPPDLADSLTAWLDALQESAGADSISYPRARVLEGLLVFAASEHREEFIAFLIEYVDALSGNPETSEGV